MSSSYQLSAHAAQRIQQRGIRPEWIERTMGSPDREVPDLLDNTLVHRLKAIVEMDNRVLRVVYNPTVEPPRIVSAHFDRRLRGQL